MGNCIFGNDTAADELQEVRIKDIIDSNVNDRINRLRGPRSSAVSAWLSRVYDGSRNRETIARASTIIREYEQLEVDHESLAAHDAMTQADQNLVSQAGDTDTSAAKERELKQRLKKLAEI